MGADIVNIGKDARGDLFHRYKMPVLQVKVEGKGNGIKTVIPNMSDIARSLARPASYPTRFFGCELGAQTTCDEKNDRYIVNGAHQADRLRELLDSFIDKFVLCASCKNPETELVIRTDPVTRSDVIFRCCKACGNRSQVDEHKLCVYITKRSPDAKKMKKKDKTAKAKSDPAANGEDGASDDSATAVAQDEVTKRIESEAVDSNVAEATSELTNTGWSEDTSTEAVKARLKSFEAGMQTSLLDDEDEDGNGPYEQFADWVTKNRETATDDEILAKAKEVGIDQKYRTVQILAQTLFTANAVQEVSLHEGLFGKIIPSDKNEKHQKALLGGIEKLCGEVYPNLVPNGVPKIIAAFYKIDILHEDVITQWGTHVSSKYVDKDVSKKVRRACEPLLKWFAEAEEEGSSSE